MLIINPQSRLVSNGGSVVLDASGKTQITNIAGGITAAGLLHVATNTTGSAAYFEQASADADGFDLFIRKTRGTVASPVVVNTGDVLGQINFSGYSGVGGYVPAAAIRATASGTIATTRVPAYLSFLTGTDAAPTVLTERMRIDPAGNLFLNHAGVTQPWPTTGTTKAVQLGAWGGFVSSSAVLGVDWVDDAYYDGTNWKYSTSNAASRINNANGIITFSAAASGTVTNTITWTSLMDVRRNAAGFTQLRLGNQTPAATLDLTTNADTQTQVRFGLPDPRVMTMAIVRQSSSANPMIGRNLIGTAGSDLFTTPYATASAVTGYNGIEFTYDGNMLFYASNAAVTAGGTLTPTTRMILTGDGNAGFNYGAMKAWPTSSNYRAFQLGSQGGILVNSSTDALQIAGNAYFDGTNWKSSSTSGSVLLGMAGGVFSALFAPSQAAGTTIGAWTTAMSVNATSAAFPGLSTYKTSVTATGTATNIVNVNTDGRATLIFMYAAGVTVQGGALFVASYDTGVGMAMSKVGGDPNWVLGAPGANDIGIDNSFSTVRVTRGASLANVLVYASVIEMTT